ncbi:MAG: DNA methyltransferase, partial [Telluria sp.]
TYRELRRLELDVLQAARQFGEPDTEQVFKLFKVSLGQFHGIEIEEFPAQVAQVAMWLTQHQMDLVAGEAFGEYFRHLPLDVSAQIRHGNALRLDWEAFVPPGKLNYILGNPPFLGKKEQSSEQKEDFEFVAGKIKGAGVLDFVACWYLKAAQYTSGTKEGFVSRDKAKFTDVQFKGDGEKAKKRKPVNAGIEDIFVAFDREEKVAREQVRCAFVSTNSITQGEQVSVLWSELFRRGIKIRFAHRTFKWSNDAPGKAAVHCVIIGFGIEDAVDKRLFDYAQIDGPAHELAVKNINAYLADAPDVLADKRSDPLDSSTPRIRYGSMPIDSGHLILSDADRIQMITEDPKTQPWIRRYLGGEEFLNGISRWCLWLTRLPPHELAHREPIKKRVQATKDFRAKSDRKTTNKLATTPTLFGEIRQPQKDYLLLPKVSSERRAYLPIGFCPENWIASGSALIVPDAKNYHLGILQSAMHMAWMRAVAGRMKSDYQYSSGIVYNNFPWPQVLDEAQRAAIDTAAQNVLDARAAHAGSTLAQLYDPDTMPPNLVKAHQVLDRAVDTAYRADGGARSYAGDAERVAFLFRRYAQLTSLV